MSAQYCISYFASLTANDWFLYEMQRRAEAG